MLRLIENPTLSTVLHDGEYVLIGRSIYTDAKNILVCEGLKYFLCTTRDDLNGGLPSDGMRVEVRRILGIGTTMPMFSWQMSIGGANGNTIQDYLDYIHGDDMPSSVDYSGERFHLLNARRERVGDSVESGGFILSGYETRQIYTGQHSYHYSHGSSMNMPKDGLNDGAYRIGIELEVEAKSRSLRDTITRTRSNWFMMETDGSLSSERGIEFVTIPLLPKDAMSEKTWNPLVKFLTGKAESYRRSSCGLHVHIGREAFGKDETERQATLGKLLYFYYECLKPEEFITKVFGRSVTYNERAFSCKESEAVKVLGTELMRDKKVREKVDKGLKDVANQTRYYDINIQNAATVEFRKGKGSICTERIVAIITYCDLMVEYCRMRPWTQLKKDDFLKFIRKYASKNSPLFRYLPTMGEE